LHLFFLRKSTLRIRGATDYPQLAFKINLIHSILIKNSVVAGTFWLPTAKSRQGFAASCPLAKSVTHRVSPSTPWRREAPQPDSKPAASSHECQVFWLAFSYFVNKKTPGSARHLKSTSLCSIQGHSEKVQVWQTD
jgi:hypothetical protein